MAQLWDGTAWILSPALSAPGGLLEAVSCPTRTACMAVGSVQAPAGGAPIVALAERWDAGTWRVLPTPVLSSDVAEHFDGNSWTVEPTPNPPPPAQSFLSGVSCPVAGVCMATGGVGSFSGSNVPLAERRERGTWTLQMPPAPAGFTTAFLQGSVACALPGVCQAVGSEQTGPVLALAEGISRNG